MKMPSTRPAIAVSMPSVPKANRPNCDPNIPSTSSIRLRPLMPKTAAITNIRNLVPTLMLKNLYAASVPANAAKVPMTAWTTRLPVSGPTNTASMNLLKAPSATPSATANASTSGGLTTRLNEFTIDSANAASEPTVSAVIRDPGTSVAVMSPVTIQVTAAVTITTAREIPVFCTTESM